MSKKAYVSCLWKEREREKNRPILVDANEPRRAERKSCGVNGPRATLLVARRKKSGGGRMKVHGEGSDEHQCEREKRNKSQQPEKEKKQSFRERKGCVLCAVLGVCVIRSTYIQLYRVGLRWIDGVEKEGGVYMDAMDV